MSDIAELKLVHAKMKSGSLYKSWATSNKGEATAFDNYVNAIVAGGHPVAPLLTTPTGQGLVGYVDAGFKTTVVASKHNGIGLWNFPQLTPNQATPKAHFEIAAGVECGGWWYADPNYGGPAKFPNSDLVVAYKNGVEIKDDVPAASLSISASCVPFMASRPEWIAQKNGKPLEAYDSQLNDLVYVAALGNTAYQNQCANNINSSLKALGLKAVYIDNCYGYVTGVSKGNVLPDGITSDQQWRDTQVIPWIINTLSQVVAAGNYVFILVGDYPETGEYYDGGDPMVRYINQLVAAEKAANKVAFHGILNEFFMQRADNNAPYHSGGGTWDGNAPSWQRLVKTAQDLGKDFHGLTYSEPTGKALRFGKGCFWLDADTTKHKSTHWVDDLSDPFLQLDLSNPSGPRVMDGIIDVRPYAGKKLYVNMTSTDATTSTGVKVPSTDSVFA